MMNIAAISKLDEGVSGLKLAGILKYVKPAKHVHGTKNGKEYSFYTQFTIIEDDSGDIPVILKHNAETDALTRDDIGLLLKCSSCKVEYYNDKVQVSGYGRIASAANECDLPIPETVADLILPDPNNEHSVKIPDAQCIPGGSLIENANLCAAIVAAGWLSSGRGADIAKAEIPGLVKLFLDTGLPF